jgi:hypothetical protein
MRRVKVPQVQTDLESRATLVSVYLLVPLLEGRTEKELIRRIGSGLVGG